MLEKISRKVDAGLRLNRREANALFDTDDIYTLGRLASTVRLRKNGRKAYYVVNRHINPTNICVNRCRFCAYSRSKGEPGAFELTTDEVISKLQKAGPDLREVHIVGGLHPEWPLKHYLDMLKAIRKSFPRLHIKAFTAAEIRLFAH